MTQSKVARLSPEKNAGWRSVSPRTTWKSDAPCRKRFMRAMAEVVRFFSWAKSLPQSVRSSPWFSRDMVNGLQQHAARAAGGIIDGLAFLGIEDVDHQPHDGARGVKLAGLLVRERRRTS